MAKRSAQVIKAELLGMQTSTEAAALVEELDASRRYAWSQYFRLKEAQDKKGKKVKA